MPGLATTLLVKLVAILFSGRISQTDAPAFDPLGFHKTVVAMVDRQIEIDRGLLASIRDVNRI